jgi:hypothetical protein
VLTMACREVVSKLFLRNQSRETSFPGGCSLERTVPRKSFPGVDCSEETLPKNTSFLGARYFRYSIHSTSPALFFSSHYPSPATTFLQPLPFSSHYPSPPTTLIQLISFSVPSLLWPLLFSSQPFPGADCS